jgi:recombinational DNA repair ATPase RecF
MSEESSVSYKLQGIEARTKSLKDLEKRSSLMMKYTPKRMAKAVLDLAESTSQLVQSLRSDIESTTQPWAERSAAEIAALKQSHQGELSRQHDDLENRYKAKLTMV